MTSFIKSALRGAQWPPKYECIKEAFVEYGINPATGRKCKLHLCPDCKGLFPQAGMKADHIVPVVGPEGFVNWDTFIARLYVEKEGFQAICKKCHEVKTKEENAQRRARKKENDTHEYIHPIVEGTGGPAKRKVFAP
jgi:5-methylcytosine-specific restriction endonuclease McrA